MDKKDDLVSNVRKSGPLTILEGGYIYLTPFKTYPLNDYDDKILLKDEKPFLKQIETLSKSWYEKFPDCCASHRKLTEVAGYDKSKYDFIPNQILNNTKYCAHALNHFLETENGMQEIKDYIDYLNASFGKPEVGGALFKKVLNVLIEGVDLPDKSFNDDERLELLEYLEPKQIQENNNDNDLEKSYLVFDKWLKSIPNIGNFRELKTRFDGKLPIYFFMNESHYNKYLDCHSFVMKSKESLIRELVKITEDSIVIAHEEIKIEGYDKIKLLSAAEDKLKVKRTILLSSKESDTELSYLTILDEWLTMIVEFYQVVNQVANENESLKINLKLDSIDDKVDKLVLTNDQIKMELENIISSSELNTWLTQYLVSRECKELTDDLNNSSDDEITSLLEKSLIEIKKRPSSDYQQEQLSTVLDKQKTSVKHKLQLSIPIFLFTKYIAEFELKNKPKLPKSMKDLRNIIF